LASNEQAMGIKPFTTDMFKRILSNLLLDMGIVSGRKLEDFIKSGWFAVVLLLRFLYKWLYRRSESNIN
jgi:hypothetical protein